jgi:hypothetical protein
MLTILAVIFSIALAIFMTMGLASAVYVHRAALPMCALIFIAILLFGALY